MAKRKDISPTTEYEDISVDDILAEFDSPQQMYTGEESADEGNPFTPAFDESSEDEGVKVYRPKSREADVKLYRPESKIAGIADGARDYVLGRIQDDFAPVSDEPQYDYDAFED